MITTFDAPDEDSEAPYKNKGKKPYQKKEIKPPKKISEKYLYNSGLAYLQRFPASSYHFKSVMMRKIDKSCRHHVEQDREKCEAWLDALVLKFQTLALLDDAAYLKGMVTSLRRRGLSSMQVNMRLGQKGYDRDEIKTAIQAYDAEEFDSQDNGDFHTALIFARKKRLGPYDSHQKRTPEKSLAVMARAGYSYDIAKKILELSEDEINSLGAW